MPNLSSTVFSWWQQRQSPPRLFANVAEKRTPISIHQVINLNNGKVLHYRTDNTLALLQLVRKRGALTPEYLANVSSTHKITADRILRRWGKSKSR